MPSVICADDERLMQTMYQTILQPKGYQVRICGDGQEALTAFAEQPADLVILDVRMPGLDGLETCELLRRQPAGAEVPIIIVSARDSEDEVARGFTFGADDYLVKPFKTGEFLAKVSLALQRKRRQQETASELEVGGIFAGRYELVRELGTGGFSSVWLAHDAGQTPAIDVALKVIQLPPGKQADRRYLSMFLREAYEHSKLEHANIAALHDFGKARHFYYLAMEFVDGKPLDEMVADNGPLAPDSLALVAYEMVKALTYMNFSGILHRDLKPGNIMITRDGDVKLLDFGLARQENEETLSLDDEFHGTPQYVSPEFIANRGDLDIRSDVYSLGCTLYFAATGRKPFDGGSIVETLNAHFDQTPPPVGEVNPEYAGEFSDLIAAMMSRRRADRPSLVAMIDVFDRILE